MNSQHHPDATSSDGADPAGRMSPASLTYQRLQGSPDVPDSVAMRPRSTFPQKGEATFEVASPILGRDLRDSYGSQEPI